MLQQRRKSRMDQSVVPSNERGSALVLALMLIFAAAAIGSILAMMSTFDTRISNNQRVSTDALYVAEAGLNEAVHRLSLSDPTIATIGGWTGNVAIADAPPYDPNWMTRIYMAPPGGVPAGTGSNVNTGTLQDLSGNYLRYSAPGGTEDVLTIEHKWEDLDGDGVRDIGEVLRYDANRIPPENFASGEPVEVVTATGRVGNGTRSVQTEVTRLPITGRTLGALFVDKPIQVKGTPAFCGFNHDIAIPDETVPNACFAWHLVTGGLPGITTTGDAVDISGGASDVLGDPAPTDTSSLNPFLTLAEVLGLSDAELNQLLASAHNTSMVNPLNGITYITGDATINANIVGEGLIYVTGDLSANGDFIYTGLVYVEGDVKFTGNPWILGAMVVRGTSDWSVTAGNASVIYSEEALRRAINRYLPMIRLSWREM
jgi:hypothetical protein